VLPLHSSTKIKKVMNTIELEAQKASLAREILSIDDQTMINNIWLVLNGGNPVVFQKEIHNKRPIGILNGKAKVKFHDDWEMTPEELGMV
jgi:hypothetical protein